MRVSVVIPTYNCAAWLPSCLDGVFAQTFPDLEVIVVDDGSTDGTAEALSPWRERIRYLRQPNAGVAAARNAGLRASSGPLVAFLDADDLWAERKLELQIAALAAEPAAGLVCSDFSIAHADGTLLESWFRERGGFETGRVFSALVRRCFIFTSTVVMRRSLLDALGGFDESVGWGDDYNMWLRAALRSRIQVVPEVLCTKRERPGNERPYEEMAAYTIAALQGLVPHAPEMTRDEWRILRSEVGRLEYSLGKHLLSRERSQEARPRLRAALGMGHSRVSAAALIGLSLLPEAAFRKAVKIRRRLRATIDRIRADREAPTGGS